MKESAIKKSFPFVLDSSADNGAYFPKVVTRSWARLDPNSFKIG